MHTLIAQQRAAAFPQYTDFLIGLSGGVDSVVLLHLFAQQPGLNLRVVHIHHGLSPHADQWASFCAKWCAQLGIPFQLCRVQVRGRQGLEANARQARYQAVSKVIRPQEVFVTAHHLDDQAETFFLALKRGSGIQGLSAMQTVGKGQTFPVFRPLLSVSKADILAYAAEQGLTWIIDESNSDNRFDRNFLRNRILPELNQRFPQFSQMVARSAQHCANQQQLIEELLHAELQQRMHGKQFDIHHFHHASRLKQQQLLRLWLASCGVMMPTQGQLQAVIDELIFANADKQPQLVLGEVCLRRYQDRLYLINQDHQSAENIAPLLQRQANELLFYKKSGETGRLLLPNALQDCPLNVRFGVTGKVKCYGKTHREEMKKIWQAHSVPPWERAHTPLLFWEEWLVAVLV